LRGTSLVIQHPGHDGSIAHDHGAGHGSDHFHDATGAAVWFADHVEMTTIGIDIGSSTSHFMFARVHMQRTSTALTSRFIVVEREMLWRSAIVLTPYRPDGTIDAERLAAFFDEGYLEAGIAKSTVDSGAIILTGEALKRENARAIADLFSAEAGKFVCALAGHHLECVFGAHGSGAVALSAREHATVLNVDIGGGTSKFTLISDGEIVASVAIAVGARLLVIDREDRIVRLEAAANTVAQDASAPLVLGDKLRSDARSVIVSRMAGVVAGVIERRAPDELSRELLLTDWWSERARDITIDAITFSGGVAEYIYGRESDEFGDLGKLLAREVRGVLGDRIVVRDPGAGIRATVIGAGQFSVQVSGNTILIVNPDELPLRNVPVLVCRFPVDDEIDPAAVARVVRDAHVQADVDEGSAPVALAFHWHGLPSHARFHALGCGIAAGLPKTLAAGFPIVLLVDGDVGRTFGQVFHSEVAPGANVISIDAIQIEAFDYVDIGRPIEPADVVPVVIKSLLF
jgi:ethanolamine utilization protein EutA